MKTVYEIKTPVGNFYIGYGEFMKNDGWSRKYSCWWNGCRIGDTTGTLESAKDFLDKKIKDKLILRRTEYNEEIKKIDLFL